jgi:hypothetical protein
LKSCFRTAITAPRGQPRKNQKPWVKGKNSDARK